jgi:nickel transport protein
MGRVTALYWLLSGLLLSLPLQAHKLKVFAYAEGDKIQGRAYFVGGAAASGAVIRIIDTAGVELARLAPDGEGRFSHQVAHRERYRVEADSLDGHQASWTLQADEFPLSLPSLSRKVEGHSELVGEAVAETPDAPQASLESEVEQAVARQIRPLREALREHEERVRLRDIIGGIGYIVGLAGFALWWSRRRHRGEQ